MSLRECGFRPVYHQICAFKLNDQLRDFIQECPDAAKSSHVVCYGYIDAKKGLMFEVLCGGKQGPKNFIFRDIYEGGRLTIPASDLLEAELLVFDYEKLLKKMSPRITPLKKYTAAEDLEKLRGEDYALLDPFRDILHPDVLRVVFRKQGLQDEVVPVRLTGIGEHCLTGVVYKKPKQDFGLKKGDAVNLNARNIDEQRYEIFSDLNGSSGQNDLNKPTKDDYENGSFLKFCIGQYLKDNNYLPQLIDALRKSMVIIPCNVQYSDEAKSIIEKMIKEGKDQNSLDAADSEILASGMNYFWKFLDIGEDKYLSTFTNESEIKEDNHQYETRACITFLDAISLAMDPGQNRAGIIINEYTDKILISKEHFSEIRGIIPPIGEPNTKNGDGTQNFFYRPGIKLYATRIPFNYALYLNGRNPIQNIQISNKTDHLLKGLSLRITSDFDIFDKYEAPLPPIFPEKTYSSPDPHLKINLRTLFGMIDAVNAWVTVELLQNGDVLCVNSGPMIVQAYDQWIGGTGYQNFLPAFVIPNHPVIIDLAQDTAKTLTKQIGDPSLDGYQSQKQNPEDASKIRAMAKAAYTAIQKKNIVYAEHPVSFLSTVGQQIRTPEIIMDQHLGTCMDMTLLYAALLENIGLHPVLVLLSDHIFAGVWLKKKYIEQIDKSVVIINDIKQLTMCIDTDELTFVECTQMCASKSPVDFEEAEAVGKQEVEELAKQEKLDPTKSKFGMAINVFLAHRIVNKPVKPIPPRIKIDGGYQIDIHGTDVIDTQSGVKDAPEINDPIINEPNVHKISNKRELWESKLLDLKPASNILLSLPLLPKQNVLPVMSCHIDELEDALSDGNDFTLLPAPDWITNIPCPIIDDKGNEIVVRWLSVALIEDGPFEIVKWPVTSNYDTQEQLRQEYKNHRLYTFYFSDKLQDSHKLLEHDLKSIYSAANKSQQENGVSSLYLGIGLLRWYETPESTEPLYAPLVLIPVEIVRKSANQGFALHIREDEPRFNTVLLEMLRQKYNLNFGGLDPLPSDEHGVDIKKVFAIIRKSLFTVKNWDVVETCVIGNFSLDKIVMWKDLHTAGDKLENSDIVRSLMKGHVDWNVHASESQEEKPNYVPISVDATQMKAIEMAAHGTSFVLHGPPGTGKSQTITGMIANLLAQNKRVLFVAQKDTALDVVQERLKKIGLENFCLELHSEKSDKKQVLSQLEKALSVNPSSRRTTYEESLRRMDVSRAKLDLYVQHLHAYQPCGYSLRQLIDLFETVRDVAHYVPFDKAEAGKLTRAQIHSHPSLISRLIAAGETLGGIASHPLIGVGLSSYSSEVRGMLQMYAENYLSALNYTQQIGAELANMRGIAAPKNKAGFSALAEWVTLFNETKNTGSLWLTILNTDSSAVYAYLNQKEALNVEAGMLTSLWKPEFLSMDMVPILAKHEAAGKKFLGKSSAMAAVTAEVQKYALSGISYEQIPDLLNRIARYQENVRKVQQTYAALPETAQWLVNQFPDRAAYAIAEKSALSFRHRAETVPDGLSSFQQWSSNPEVAGVCGRYMEMLNRMYSAEKALDDLLKRQENEDAENWVESEKEFCLYLMRNRSVLKDWGIYNQIRQECMNAGLSPVVKAYEEGLSAGELESAYQKGLYYALIHSVINSDDVLSGFSGTTFNEAVWQFEQLDTTLIEQTKKEIYNLLASRIPSDYDSPEIGKELNLLRKAISSNGRGISIRSLIERIPHVLPKLCPCMLMSPDAVAQYLAQDSNLFDVVIFDEASQLPTCKAIGALYRAKSAVIVGDPKQMPPTRSKSGFEVDDLALNDLDSILDDVKALGIPSQHLQWHYRSQHESLIAFCNETFYNNKMYTFPSADDLETRVRLIPVKGKFINETNEAEAKAIVEEIVRRFLDPELKKQTIGVVAFSQMQMKLIENLLDKQYRKNAELYQWANKREKDEQLFVKNLANVQGEERDVILFSIAYGPNEKGVVYQGFKSVEGDDGGRYLNVALTRAKEEMIIFTSLSSGDVRLDKNPQAGKKAFHDFLEFVENQNNQADSSSKDSENQANAGILQNICKAIEEHGYACKKMVGHSDFRVDIAVVDPFVPTRYLMGILLDGESYRQTRSTRDRELSQIGLMGILLDGESYCQTRNTQDRELSQNSVKKNSRGWKLMRIWTMDWWDNREKVIKQLLEKLDALKAESAKNSEDAAASEETRKVEETAREAETAKVRAELETQVAEVLAEEAEAEKAQGIVPDSIPQPESPEISQPEKDAPAESEPEPEPQPETQDETVVPAEDQLIDLLRKIEAESCEIIDKRGNGGVLWITGGKSLAPLMKHFGKLVDARFIFRAGGGKATKGRDAWWAKTDVVLPETGQESAPVEEPVQEPVSTPAAAIPEEKPDESADTEGVSSNESSQPEELSAPVDYVEANLPVTKVSQAEFAAPGNKAEIATRMQAILDAEAPMLKDTLFRKIWASFGILKTNAAIDATEKAMKSGKIKTSKLKGVIYCWAADQHPKTYTEIRVNSSRSGDEICPQEIRNAACYALKTKGELSKDDLIKEVSRLFGYKRLGPNLIPALAAGIQYAKSSGAITSIPGGKFALAQEPQVGDEE